MRVAITGGTGVLGSALSRRLAEGMPDVELLRLDIRPAPGVQVCDIRDTEKLVRHFEGSEVVVHAAAALPSYSAEQIRSTDVDGTQSVLRAAEVAGVPHVIHVSSTAVYGLPKHTPTPEDYPRQGVDPYSRAKIQAELICEKSRTRFEGVTILRPKTFLGPGRMGIFSMLFEWAEEGLDFPVLGDGSQLTQMLDVNDLCSVILSVLELPPIRTNTAFNLGATEYGSIREDFQSVLDEAGRGGRVRSIPMAPALVLLRGASAVGASPVYPRLLHKLRNHSFVDTQKAQEVLGFAPGLSNAESLRRTFRWWRSDANARSATPGKSHDKPWRQGILRLTKPLFA